MLTVALLVVGVLAVSLSGPLVAFMTIPALAVAFWRNAAATVALTPLVAARREEARATSRRDRIAVVAAGLALALHFGTWVVSLRLTSVASSMALLSLQVGWVALWETLRGRRYDPRVLLGLGIAVAGVVVVTGVDLRVSREAFLGDLLALVSGIGTAAYMVIGGRVRPRLSTTVYTWGCYGTCALALLLVCALGRVPLLGFPAEQWALLALLTVTAQFLGHSVFNHLLDRLSALVIGLVLLLEVPGAALLAWPLLGQVPSPAAALGVALLLAGTVLVLVYDRSEESHEVVPA